MASDAGLILADGGISGFLYPTLWELITDTSEEVPLRSPITMLLEQLEESPRFRRGQIVGALMSCSVRWRGHHTQATGDEQMSLPVGTVMVLAHVLLRHQA